MGFSTAAEQLCWDTMLETLRVADEYAQGTPIGTLAEQKDELTFVETTFAERFDVPEKTLAPGLVNFQPVQAGQALHAPDSPPLIVPAPGAILFPKYPDRDNGLAVAPWPKEIYRLVSPMTEHPMSLWEPPTES